MEIINGIFSESFWYIAPLLMTANVSLTGVINGLFKIVNGMWPQIVSWVVGSILAVIAWALKLVEFGQPVWLGVVALAIVTGLSSNGIYDIPAIKAFVDKWFNRIGVKIKRKEIEIAAEFEDSGLAKVIRKCNNDEARKALEKTLWDLSRK